MMLCVEKSGAEDQSAAPDAVVTWLRRELLFERLLGCWRAAGDADDVTGDAR